MKLVARLLNLVTPRCSFCVAPATQFEGTNYSTESPTSAKRYGCDAHAGEKGWTDLPGAETVREAERDGNA